MANVLKSVTLNESGHVYIVRMVDGVKWRRAVSPHHETELDTHAPEISAGDRQDIMDKWATIPVPTPAPVEPPPTDDEIYEGAVRGDRVFKAVALVCAEQFGMTGAQMKAAVKAKM